MTRYERVIKVQLYKVITFSLCFDQRVCCLSIVVSTFTPRLLYIHRFRFHQQEGLTSNYIYCSFIELYIYIEVVFFASRRVDYSSNRVLTIVICQLTINEIRSGKLD